MSHYRTYLVLSAMRWLPTGTLIPILVLYEISRGLTLTEVGMVAALQSGVILLLELPAGGLADAIGRRPVLAVAAAVSTASVALLLVANGFAGIAVAMALQAVFRALDSGPLEAWYVDAALAADPGRDLERDLSHSGVVIYAAVAVGSLLTAGAAVLPGDPLTAAVVVALVLEGANLVAVLLLLREHRPRAGVRAAVASAGATAAFVRGAVRLGWSRRALRLLVGVELFWGAGLLVVEVLWQPHIADLVGSDTTTSVFGPIAAAGWVAGAAGSALVPTLVRRARWGVSSAAALLRVLQALTMLGIAAAGGSSAPPRPTSASTPCTGRPTRSTPHCCTARSRGGTGRPCSR